MGTEKSKGFGIFSLSGHVTRPGQYEAPLGITLRELLDLAGGIRAGHRLKFWTPGGSSTPLLHRRAPGRAAGLRVRGRGRVHARHPGAPDLRRDHLRGPRRAALDRVLRARVLRQVHAVPGGQLLGRAGARAAGERARAPKRTWTSCSTSADNIPGRAFCALGDGATSPIKSSIKYFRDEYLEHCGRRLPVRPGRLDGLGASVRTREDQHRPSVATERRARPEACRERDLVTVTIDGFEITVPKGTLVIRAAELLGIQIPRFCDHPLLEPVGACRQCLVDIPMRQRPGAQAAALPAPSRSPTGMVVQHPAHLAGGREGAARRDGAAAGQPPARLPDVRQGRRVPAAEPGHVQRPGRDPVRGGKRHLRQAGRAVQRRCCWTASAASSAPAAPGSPTRSPATRSSTCSSAGAKEQVGIADGEPFESYFSGNTVQICPVGALTGAAYRFRARPFDLVSTPSVVRALRHRLRAAHRPPARQGHPPAGRRRPGGQRGVELRQGPLGVHLRDPARPAADPAGPRRGGRAWCRPPGRRRSPPRPRASPRRAAAAGVLAGGRLTVEDAYAYAKFARIALGTNDIDFRARPHSAEEARFLAHAVAGQGDRGHATPTWRRRPAVLLVGLRARGGVADRLPAPAQGVAQEGPEGLLGRAVRHPGLAKMGGTLIRRCRAPRPPSWTTWRAVDAGEPPRRCSAAGRGHPGR